MIALWRWLFILDSLIRKSFTEENKLKLILEVEWKCDRWTKELRRKRAGGEKLVYKDTLFHGDI